MLQTDRLILCPLDAARLRLWADDIPALERQMDISYRGEPMEGPFRRCVKARLEILALEPENVLWHSFWLIIRKDDRVAVGAIGFDEPPRETGEVELGYGLGPGFKGRGYMQEAAAVLCRWALSQPGVKAVVARTDPENLPSQQTLSRCGFELYKKDFHFWWRLEKTETPVG